MQAVVGELVDVGPSCSSGQVTGASGDVLEAEQVFRKPGNLEDDPPGTGEVGDVNLQAAEQTGPGDMLSVAVSALGRGDSFAFVASASGLQTSTGGFGKPGQVGREKRIVEVDGRLIPAQTPSLICHPS